MDFLDLTLPSIEENLALDELLLLEVEEGSRPPLLRLWESPRYAVVLGASGRIDEDVIRDACEREGVPIARRSSGGGTVVVGPGALNFTVVLSRDFAPGLDAVDRSQAFVLERVAQAIRDEGPPVKVSGSGDLSLEGKKVSGSAQRRLKQNFLIHATLLYEFELSRIWRYTRNPSRQPSYREGRSHQDFVANLGVTRSNLERSLKKVWLPDPQIPPHGRVDEDRIEAMITEKFGLPSWIGRL